MPKSKKQQGNIYKGILKNPIIISKFSPSPTLLTGSEDPEVQKSYSEKRKKELLESSFIAAKKLEEKFDSLMKHYKISADDESSWKDLAIALAFDHVPGFQSIIKGETGRPEFWNDFVLAKLYLEVNKHKQETGKATSEVCRILVKHEPWRQGLTAKTLQNRYSEAKDSSIVKAYYKLLADTEARNSAKDFEKMIEKLCWEHYFKNLPGNVLT